MSLRQRPQVSPLMIAANRANAQKSTGPRSGMGKAQVALNPLKHGAYTDRFFRSHLLLAHEDVDLPSDLRALPRGGKGAVGARRTAGTAGLV